MAVLIAIPFLGVLAVLQSSLISRLPLLQGTPDLIMLALISWTMQKRVQTAWQWSIIGGLMAGLYSAVPFGVYLAGYGLTTGLALILRRRVWQVPVLAVFLVAFLGTLIIHGITLLALRLTGSTIQLWQALNLVTLPSILLNLLFALPIYAVVNEIAGWLYPEEIEV
ncbi:MAG: rod shape-determining protein MreD [Anaerolineales bacterium]